MSPSGLRLLARRPGFRNDRGHNNHQVPRMESGRMNANRYSHTRIGMGLRPYKFIPHVSSGSPGVVRLRVSSNTKIRRASNARAGLITHPGCCASHSGVYTSYWLGLWPVRNQAAIRIT